MMHIFIDTNVVLDFILCRDGEQEAMDIFQLGEDKKVSLNVSYLTMANVAYVARKHRTREELYTYLRELSALFCILPMDESQYQEALLTEVSDFEDMLQFVCAKNNQCEVIITNNTKHFSFSTIPVVTPAQYLADFHNR